MDADTRELLAGSIRALLNSRPADPLVGLSELGWAEVVSEDEAAAVDILFTEQGKVGTATSALDAVMVAAAGGDLDDTDRARPPVVIHPIGRARSGSDSDTFHVDGVALCAPSEPRVAVVADAGSDLDVYALTPDQWSPSTVPIRGFDPASGLHRVRADRRIDEVQRCKADWPSAIAAARRALASELVGNAQAMSAIAVDQVGQRMQFGRPIGANQAPRHRLAECYTQVAAARELIRVAWESRSPWDAFVAKTYAGLASDATSRACLQVCGAIGLTWEHPLGAYVKRSRILDALYGGWQASLRDIGTRLLDTRTVPVGPSL